MSLLSGMVIPVRPSHTVLDPLMEMYFGVKCFSLQVLLYQIAAVVLYNLRLRLLYSWIVFAFLAHVNRTVKAAACKPDT